MTSRIRAYAPLSSQNGYRLMKSLTRPFKRDNGLAYRLAHHLLEWLQALGRLYRLNKPRRGKFVRLLHMLDADSETLDKLGHSAWPPFPPADWMSLDAWARAACSAICSARMTFFKNASAWIAENRAY